MPDQRRSFSTQQRAQRIDAFGCLRGTSDNRNLQPFVNAERFQCVLTIGSQINFVDADGWLRAAALGGDEESIDEAGAQRRISDRDDVDDRYWPR